MTDFAQVDAYLAEHIQDWMGGLRELCRVPSVSARHEAIPECAELVATMLRRRGFSAEVSPTGDHPVVIAEAGGTNPGRRLLFYNHYDVQPPEPLELWESPPFELTERDGAVYARGAKDDKGEFVCRLAALDALKAIDGAYPCHITWLAEGEEESGSYSLPEWIEKNADRVAVDGCIWEEGGIDEEGHPIVTLGARGLLYIELSVQTLSRDAHSGGANLLPNANWRLIWALASLKGADERVLIPGFYDAVRVPTPREEELLALIPSTEEAIKKEYGLREILSGRTGPQVPRAPFDPTCNVAGIGGGYQGEGSKTVIPARAGAKVDFRLVPNQDPLDILEKLRRHLDAGGFDDVAVKVLGAERPGVTPADDPMVGLVLETGREVYGKDAKITPLGGGTTPKFLFTEKGIPVVAPGVGFANYNRAHSPNEFMRLKDFEMAARHIARLAVRFAEA